MYLPAKKLKPIIWLVFLSSWNSHSTAKLKYSCHLCVYLPKMARMVYSVSMPHDDNHCLGNNSSSSMQKVRQKLAYYSHIYLSKHGTSVRLNLYSTTRIEISSQWCKEMDYKTVSKKKMCITVHHHLNSTCSHSLTNGRSCTRSASVASET
jgi:hypothetical protein